MIKKISSYVEEYINPFENNDLPGEHHFVASYLVPKIFRITNRIPYYINPDGMKKKPGDIIYDNKFSIEVKYLKINLTYFQYNEWIKKKKERPSYLIALGRQSLCMRL